VSHVYDPKGFSCLIAKAFEVSVGNEDWIKSACIGNPVEQSLGEAGPTKQESRKSGTHKARIEPLNQAVTQSRGGVTGVLGGSSAALVRQQDQAHELNYGGKQLKDNHTEEQPEGAEEKQVMKLKETECPGR
jgi:hypothetical protein